MTKRWKNEDTLLEPSMHNPCTLTEDDLSNAWVASEEIEELALSTHFMVEYLERFRDDKVDEDELSKWAERVVVAALALARGIPAVSHLFDDPEKPVGLRWSCQVASAAAGIRHHTSHLLSMTPQYAATLRSALRKVPGSPDPIWEDLQPQLKCHTRRLESAANDLDSLLCIDTDVAEKGPQVEAPNSQERRAEKPQRKATNKALWPKVAEQVKRHVRAKDGIVPSDRFLAHKFGCSRSTVRKAIENDPYLRARKAESDHGAVRQVQWNDAIAADAAEARHTDAAREEEATQQEGESTAEGDQHELETLIDEQEADKRRDERQWKARKRRYRPDGS